MRAAFLPRLCSGRNSIRPREASHPIVGVMGVLPKTIRQVPKTLVAPATSRLGDRFSAMEKPRRSLHRIGSGECFGDEGSGKLGVRI